MDQSEHASRASTVQAINKIALNRYPLQ